MIDLTSLSLQQLLIIELQHETYKLIQNINILRKVLEDGAL